MYTHLLRNLYIHAQNCFDIFLPHVFQKAAGQMSFIFQGGGVFTFYRFLQDFHGSIQWEKAMKMARLLGSTRIAGVIPGLS